MIRIIGILFLFLFFLFTVFVIANIISDDAIGDFILERINHWLDKHRPKK